MVTTVAAAFVGLGSVLLGWGAVVSLTFSLSFFFSFLFSSVASTATS